MSPKTIAISIAAGAGLLIVGSVAWAISQAVAALIAAHATIFGLLALSSAVIGLLGGARVLLAIGAQQRAKAWQGELTRLQNGLPMHVHDVRAVVPLLAARSLDNYEAAELERAKVSPALSHLHIEQHPALPPDLLSQLLSTSSPAPQLAGSDAAPQLIAADEWRGWIDRAPHLLIAGRTEAGKTTLATALLIDRALGGDAVLVLDPHYQPGKWAGVPTIGGGNDFEAILRTLPLLIREMTLRFQEFERGRPTEAFQRLTILIDEVPAIVSACMEVTPSGSQRIIDPRWVKFAQRLGSEARKVRISVILLTQSALVRDIQINSQLRDNYLRIGLGDRVPTLLEEASGRRRVQLHALRAGQAHPAAMEWQGEIHVLDTSQVPSLATRALGAAVQIWTPPALAAAQPPSAATPPPTSLTPTERVPVLREAPPTTQLPPLTVKDQILMLLDARADQWLTHSEIAASLGVDLGVIRTEAKELFDTGTVRRRETKRNNERVEYATNQSTNQPETHISVLSA